MVFTLSKQIDITKNVGQERIWKLSLLSIIASLPFFTHGIVTNTLTASAHSGHFVTTPVDVPWSATAMILAAMVSGPIYCYVMDRFGRKIGIYLIDLVQAASCIPLFLTLSPNDVSTIFLHILAGISSAGIFTVLPVYVREIMTDRYRAVIMSVMMVLITLGYLMKLALGMETMMYVIVAFAALQLISMYFLLETPSFFVKAKKFETALRQMAKLKCLPEDHPAVLEAMKVLTEESVRATANGELTLLSILRNQIWRSGIKIGIILNTVMMLCGSTIFLDQSKALTQMKIEEDTEFTMVLYSLFGGSILCLFLIRYMERKHLLTLALTAMVLSMGFLAVYNQADLTVTTFRWAPVVALCVLVCGYGVAWNIPTIILVEIFNFEIRAKYLGVIYAYTQLIKILHVHSIRYIEDYVGVYTLLYIFAVINIYGAVYTLFAVPDLKEKSIRMIEKQLKKVPLLEFKSQPAKVLPS